ncbi:N-acetylgalactosaminyltransferase 7-like [Lineus longissimus]|uniref:N-acetylgalactosaminyltransferase 7-like n=1 Tax=Lineus longissimus TaxID=88925 RepID=UPI002B4C4565
MLIRKIRMKLITVRFCMFFIALIIVAKLFQRMTPNNQHDRWFKKTAYTSNNWLMDQIQNRHVGLTRASIEHQDVKIVFKEGVVGAYEKIAKKSIIKSGKVGHGENGKAVQVARDDAQFKRDGLNIYASDVISLDRAIPDGRPEECQYWHYPSKAELSTASIVITTPNYLLSPLLRTIHSVFRRGPLDLVNEVILINHGIDKSTGTGMKSEIETHIATHSPEVAKKVKYFKTKGKLDIVSARNIGAGESSGDVIVFLEAGSECGINWLSPLLARIAENSQTLAVPRLDKINPSLFSIKPFKELKDIHFGIFDWGLKFTENLVPPKIQKKRNRTSAPYWSPAFNEGVFAIGREYFLRLGGYGPALEGPMGADLEMSFKVWQCGGRVEFVPCSHIAVLDKKQTTDFDSSNSSTVHVNLKLIAMTWMDNIKANVYRTYPMLQHITIGDNSQMMTTRKRLKCKSFDWYMREVAYEVVDRFPYLSETLAWGELTHKGNQAKCLDQVDVAKGKLRLTPCRNNGGTQLFILNSDGQLLQDGKCVNGASAGVLYTNQCGEPDLTGEWQYYENEFQLFHFHSELCARMVGTSNVGLRVCQKNVPEMQWVFRPVFPRK